MSGLAGADPLPDTPIDPRLGQWLRSRRQATRPVDVGLPANPRGRRPWLTQVEVARLAGLTPRAYQGVEQSSRPPGPRVLEGVAHALHLTEFEAAHLTRLANTGKPPSERADTAWLDAVIETHREPAVAYDRMWGIVGCNEAFSHQLPLLASSPQPNLLRWFFTAAEARRLFVDWRREAAELIAQFRATQAYYRDRESFDAFMSDLGRHSLEARRLWSNGWTVAPEPTCTVYRLRSTTGPIYSTSIVRMRPAGEDVPSVRVAVVIPRRPQHPIAG
jgi:transcriptional regulator with XRE-family HTH domain